jgi:hypothetical protein
VWGEGEGSVGEVEKEGRVSERSISVFTMYVFMYVFMYVLMYVFMYVFRVRGVVEVK